MRHGVDQALRNLRLDDYIGRPAADLLIGLAERLLPSPDSADDAAARKAGLEAFHELLLQYGALEDGINALDALDADGIQHALEHFIARYITADLLSRLSQRVENGSSTVERCDEILSEIRNVVLETIRLDFKGRDVLAIDWPGREGRQFIDRQLLNAYGLLEEEERENATSSFAWAAAPSTRQRTPHPIPSFSRSTVATMSPRSRRSTFGTGRGALTPWACTTLSSDLPKRHWTSTGSRRPLTAPTCDYPDDETATMAGQGTSFSTFPWPT
ncbi:MAG: hypothetical protein F4X59_02835 [Holophagales bacterium]|nr:hypothetical protein [Holophagales bacterium]MYC09047.1 hypothetical protein [Holophagales bacterium]